MDIMLIVILLLLCFIYLMKDNFEGIVDSYPSSCTKEDRLYPSGNVPGVYLKKQKINLNKPNF